MEVSLRFNIRPATVSVFLHALILLLAYFILIQEGAPGSKKGEPIQIESITEKRASKKEKQSFRHAQTRESRTASKAVPDGITLGSLAMRMDYSRQAAKEQDFYQPMPENQFAEPEPSDDWDVMNPDPRLARFNLYIYNTVQGWLDRDAHLNRTPLTGTVRVKIWFSAEGEYLESETVFDAVDPNFQAVVERALRKSFTNPIPKMYLTQKKKFFIERTVVLRN